MPDRVPGDGAGVSRRRALAVLGAAAAGSTAFRSVLAAAAASPKLADPGEIRRAAWLSGIELTRAEAELMAKGVAEMQADFAKLRAVPLDNAVPPALVFDPEPGGESGEAAGRRRLGPVQRLPGAALLDAEPGPRPADADGLAWLPVTELAPLVRTRQVSAVELARAYLDRIRRFDPVLHALVTSTEVLALAQAASADRDLAAGRYRGPLHGIPWVAKDLLAVPGYPTTWGSVPYETQVRPEKATVAARLEEAGAVLLGKSSLGELAMGDVWFGGTTRNPWKLEQGSSGSSAGSAAMTAAGLTAFAIGSETWGSIVSPCTRCGVTGLRPTFGRVSRFGAMALSWSMDKLGAIARSVEDCALVLGAIEGPDGLDPVAVDRPFAWPPRRDVRTLRVGFVPALFDEERGAQVEDPADRADLREWAELDRKALEVLDRLGIPRVAVTLPADLPVSALSWILTAEAAAAFDDLTRSGRDDELVQQVEEAWPTYFRLGQLVPAVEYVRANRIRTLLMRRWEQVMRDLDVLVVPSYGGDVLLATNLTGHPCVVVPDGFLSRDGTPVSLSFVGRLYGESELLAVAHAWQQATTFHLERPPLRAEGGGEPR